MTVTISPDKLHIPMSGRDADLQQVIAHLAGGYVTSILGVGGLGKSRLAAEVVLRDEWADGAVWHVASDYSTADDALALLREHLALPTTASRADVLHAVRAHKTLVVIDNAESVTDARLTAYVALVNDLKVHRRPRADHRARGVGRPQAGARTPPGAADPRRGAAGGAGYARRVGRDRRPERPRRADCRRRQAAPAPDRVVGAQAEEVPAHLP